jgi:hypothetical protein
MKKLMILAFVFAIISTANAQVKTPQASTFQTNTQIVGLTNVELSYSRPSMKGRKIFGNLVPYNKLWRTGANANTTISFDENVMIGGKIIKAGTYAIYTKPNMTSWEVYFYSDASNSGTPKNWDSEKVVATVKANVVSLPFEIETFTLQIDDVTNDTANLGMMWENVYIAVPIRFMTDSQVTESITSVMNGPSSGDYYTSAVYYLNAGKDIDKAKMWIDKAIEMRENPAFWYYRQQSLIYAKAGDKKGAIKAAKESLKLAKEAGNDDYIALNKESLSIWEGKKPVNK